MKNIIRFLTGKVAMEKEGEEGSAFYDDLVIDVLSRTLWGEARGEGAAGMEAVACVILNRVRVAERKAGKYWWGNDIISVCQKPYQFSCWNRSDPNYRRLLNVDDSDIHFNTARRIARRAVAGTMEDFTGGATHYYADYIAAPTWARGETPTFKLGRHIFFKLIEA
jgi:N-acetylmuramoyl-L-alanine amidase